PGEVQPWGVHLHPDGLRGTPMTLVLGMDIGGTSIKLGAWRGAERVYWREGIALPQSSLADEACMGIRGILGHALAELPEAPAALGVGSCGLIAAGEVLYSPNTPWQSLPLQSSLGSACDYPVNVINDADAFLMHALQLLPSTT